MNLYDPSVTLAGTMSPTEELLEEARCGRMFILVDEERENEGDLVIPAQFASPDAINFMAKHARGLICLALTKQRVERLGLPLMAQSNNIRHQTAFTVSIEARDGVTTGISAADRARTVGVAINPELGPEHIVSPGHVFPLVAREGGVLVRAGHTEAAVDFARLAGLNPAGVICGIMSDDGTMAQLPDLELFARRHRLKLGTIAGLIEYRRRTERLVRRVEEGILQSPSGASWRVVVYASGTEPTEHLALVMGDVAGPSPVLARVHAANLLSDTIGHGGLADVHRAVERIEAEGCGIVVLIRDPAPTTLSDRLRARKETAPAAFRRCGIGAQILADLGAHCITLITNQPKAFVGLDGYGLRIAGYLPLGAG